MSAEGAPLQKTECGTGDSKEQQAEDGLLSLTAVRDNAEARLALLPVIDGAEFASAAAGVRYRDRPDVMLARLAPGTQAAGFFTQSTTRAAPVLDCQKKLRSAPQAPNAGLAVFANSGNANAFTGPPGDKAVRQISDCVSESLGIPHSRVLTASTGVIGEPLETGRILASVGQLKSSLSPEGLAGAARAIMTTDTFPKAASAQIRTGRGVLNIAGIAKGSGMIAPNMATMLAFVFTDAKIGGPLLHSLSSQANTASFNAVTVDGDTSTNDTLIVAATGKADHPELTAGEAAAAAFSRGLRSVMASLAEQIVRDGEGAAKLIRVRVKGAANEDEARAAAQAVANSPLVKTAVAGEDPNWGRIVMAVGKSGAELDAGRMAIWLGRHLVAKDGMAAPDHSEERAAAYMKEAEIDITVALGSGDAEAQVLTCDLTHGYITINADYRS